MGLNAKELGFVENLVFERVSVVMDPQARFVTQARLSNVAKKEGLDSVSLLVQHLREQPFGELHRRVVEAMATRETSFFRDEAVFDTIEKIIIPDLLQKRAFARELRIWSAGCATGQEPYSLAMLLRERFLQIKNWKLQIIASDASMDSLAKAKSGIYTKNEAGRGMPRELFLKYFEQRGFDWTIDPAIRDMITFRELNFARSDSFDGIEPMDLILLRNVLIYFDAATKERILQKIAGLLAPGGYLLLGAGERPAALLGLLERSSFGGVDLYRRPRT